MSLPPSQPSFPQYSQHPAPSPAYPPQPGFPPQYPQNPAPSPFLTGPAFSTPPAPSRRPSLPQVMGAVAVQWALALIVLIALWGPIEKWVIAGMDDTGGASFESRVRVSDWVLYTVPFLVGGIAAAVFLRPGIARVGIAAAIAVVIPLVAEFGVVASLNHAHMTHLAPYFAVYALELTALGLAWLVLRGRSPARVLIGLTVLPLDFLLLFAHRKLILSGAVARFLYRNDFYHGILSGLLFFFFVAVALAVPMWLAAIGQPAPNRAAPAGPRSPAPAGPWSPAPAGWPAPNPGGPIPGAAAPGAAVPGASAPGAPAGWAAPASPAWSPGPAAPTPTAQPGWAAPGAGQVAPGYPAPQGSPYLQPGQSAPYHQPGQGGWPNQ
jgi:hypothetical protein